MVAKERPDLEEQKRELVVQSAENSRQLKEIEDQIISVLSSSEGNILEDETAINVISSSKALSNDIAIKQVEAQKTEQVIDETRAKYTPVALHAAQLFFNISDLCNIEPMYQYSLTWYLALFVNAIAASEKSDDLDARIAALNAYFQYSLYCQICRSLFEKDKLLYSFTLLKTIKVYRGEMDPAAFRFFLTGGIPTDKELPVKPAAWLSDKAWGEINRLGAAFEAFSEYPGLFAKDPDAFFRIYDSAEPHNEPLPEPLQSSLSGLERAMVLRTIRPDKLLNAVHAIVLEELGQKYVEPPPFDLGGSYGDSTAITPLIFVLSPGSDPMTALLAFSAQEKKNVESISLGQGQGPIAAKLIEEARANGGWVVLQNCHLAVSWMPTLERICEGITADNTSPNFRLWLTSYPSSDFPVSILQNGVKMTNEPPRGLRANIMQSYIADPIKTDEFFLGCEGAKARPFKAMLFGLCFFHAFVQERIKFGPLGWNIPYGFNDPDLKISMRQLQMFVNEQDEVPLKALRYLIGECNYGGRVTDDHDRKTLLSILQIFFTPRIYADEGYTFTAEDTYHARACADGDYQGALGYIRNLPVIATPDVFGLHANASITKDQQEVDLLLQSILDTLGTSSAGSGQSPEAIVGELAADLERRLPDNFDLEVARYKFPVLYEESMNSVLIQEMVRFNRLTSVIRSSLKEVQKALKGLSVMSSEIEGVYQSMFNNKIPALWLNKSYPSLKPLSSYFSNLLERLSMLSTWMENGAPVMFNLSNFFFTQAFLTGVMQNFARKHTIPIDTVAWDFEMKPEDEYAEKPEDGAYVNGLFLEGARFDKKTMMLAESEPKVLYTNMPVVRIVPMRGDDIKPMPSYSLPIYRTAERRGVLATTGHSSNFVLDMRVPTDKDPSHWTLRGVAALLNLSD